MEKRIDENAAPLHVHAASTDPGFIPGITPAKPVAPEGADAPVEPEQGEKKQPTESAAAETAEEPDAAESADERSEKDDAAEEAEEPDAEADAPEGADDDAAAELPAFEALDHRGSITVDRTGLRFRLDDQEAEFDWDELGAVEHATSRFGRRLTVTAHTLAGRAYPAEVQAPDKATLKRWTTELDTVLDAHFEE